MSPVEESRATSCSFCGRDGAQARNLISGKQALICYTCVDACVEVMAGKASGATASSTLTFPKPTEIKEHLDQYVVDQDHAKKTLAVALHNHHKRTRRGRDLDGPELQKSNVLLIGPTGSGKTHLVRTLSKLLRVPFAIVDATSFTQAGYIGDDVEQAVSVLLQNADYDVDECQRGILYVDEIDKIARRSASESSGRDVSGEGVQQALLKLMEGSVVRVPKRIVRNQQQQELVSIDTSGILFIFGGAFCGLEDVVRRRLKVGMMGFGSESGPTEERSDLLKDVQVDDLVSFGMIPEFVGRVPVVAVLDQLDLSSLVRILTEPRDALVRQYKTLAEMDGVELRFTDDAIESVARMALERNSGARGLRAILESVLMDVMYEIPSLPDVRTVTISEGVVRAGERAAFGG